MPGKRKCRGCGVTDKAGVPPIAGDGRPFYWVHRELCSRCALTAEFTSTCVGKAEAARMLSTNCDVIEKLVWLGHLKREYGSQMYAVRLDSIRSYQEYLKEVAKIGQPQPERLD